MSVYVEELRKIYLKRDKWRYDEACHLMADSDEQLETFAKKLELCKDWKHNDHYDLTRNKRSQAINLGAIETTSRQFCLIRKAYTEP